MTLSGWEQLAFIAAVTAVEADALYAEHLLLVELVQLEQAATLRCLARHHGLRQVYGDRHQIIRHSDHEYVVGAVHTNTIEGFWSILKRGVVGTFHKVSAKYMALYVAEFQFRYNNRENVDIFGVAIAGC